MTDSSNTRFVPGRGTVRDCLECGKEVDGGPTRCVPCANPPDPPIFASTDAATRKEMPVATGFMKYFPNAIKCVAYLSKVGNDQHNPGQPLHWAKEKSQDEEDACARHFLDDLSNAPQDPRLARLGKLGHKTQKAWRAMADLERACEAALAEYEASK